MQSTWTRRHTWQLIAGLPLLLASKAWSQVSVPGDVSTTECPGTDVSLPEGVSQTCGSGNSAQVQQFFNRLATLPTTPRQTLYANLINGLVSDGVWSLLDVLVILAAADSATALTNLVSGSFNATLVATPTFTIDRGFVANGSISYVSSNFNASSAGGNFTQNSAFLGAWSLTTTSSGSALLRSIPDNAAGLIEMWNTQPNVFSAVNNSAGTENTSANPGDSSGWFVADRSASNALTVGRNNTQIGSFATASAASENNIIQVGYGNSTSQIAAYAFGADLGAPGGTNQTALYNRLTTFLHAVGAV